MTGKRKLIVALVTIIASAIICGMGHLASSDYVSVIMWTLVTFAGANAIGDHGAFKKAPNSEK